MTHPGPDFLPYPLPEVTTWETQPIPSSPPPPPGGRWSRALDDVPPVGIVAVGSGLGALALLVLVVLVADRPGAGAFVTALAAAVSLVTGRLALRALAKGDGRSIVVAAQTVGVLSAVVAALVWTANRGDEQTVSPPLPQPTASSAPTQDPQQPAPSATPLPSVPPPGAVNGFGVPSDPGSPLSDDPTALGTLQGHVVDTGGQPVARAVVTVTRSAAGDTSSTPQCPTRLTTLTDAQGVYRLQLCQLGDGLGYHVRITVGRSVAESDVFVNSGNTTTYDVILPR